MKNYKTTFGLKEGKSLSLIVKKSTIDMQGNIQAELVKPKCGVLSFMKSKNKVTDKKG